MGEDDYTKASGLPFADIAGHKYFFADVQRTLRADAELKNLCNEVPAVKDMKDQLDALVKLYRR